MKQLNTYLEGLLNKSGKTSTGSSIEMGITDFIEKNIKYIYINKNVTYSISNKEISLDSNQKSPSIIMGDHIKEFANKYSVKKIIFNGKWAIALNSDFNTPISIECDQELSIERSVSLGKSIKVENLNIKSKVLKIWRSIKVRKSNIQAEVLRPYDHTSILACNNNVNTVIFVLYRGITIDDVVANLGILPTCMMHGIRYIDWKTQDPEQFEDIKNIDPILMFKLNNSGVQNIILDDEESILMFTKKPKSYQLKYPDTYKMANGWCVVWLEDLKQFEL